MEINYSKKQINPLISKYCINVEKNTVFQSLILMFNEQPNYQVWAIKAVFEGIATVDDIKNIHDWAENNSTEIKNLIKGNIVSYKTKTDFANLFREMNGIEKIKFVSDIINRFNTAQRKMLKDNILSHANNGFEAENSSNFNKYYEIFKGIATLAKHRQEKLISTSSAIDNFPFLMEHISNALKETYSWEKNDMLGYMARNCKDCSMVYENGNIVVVNVNSFDSSKKLCGGGRTGWCLTRQESYFKQYTKDNNNAKQYFVFNFDKREDHELAHIGVSVNPSRGITHSHTTRNNNLMGTLSIDGKNMNIYGVLEHLGIPKNVFIHFSENKNFTWTIDSFLEYIGKNKEHVGLSYSGDNRIIVYAFNKKGFNDILNHTFLSGDNFRFNNDTKNYILLDFNLPKDDDKAIVTMTYNKDQYKIDTLQTIFTGYNVNVTHENYLQKIGIDSDMYLNREDVDPKILLHKYIDEKNERAAIELLKKYGTDLDINYEFNSKIPVFSIIENNLFNLFGELINMPNFDNNVKDFTCENLFQSLLYKYLSDNEYDKTNVENDKKMINKIIEADNFDINVVDMNDDTAMHIICSDNKHSLNWVFDKMISKANINLNIVNDFNCTPLGSAIISKNIHAIKALLSRKDVIVREEDYELASNHGIDLKSMVEDSNNTKVNVSTTSTEQSFAELFAKALGL